MVNAENNIANRRRSKEMRRSFIRRLRTPILMVIGVAAGAFVAVPLNFHTLNIQPEIIRVSEAMANIPPSTPRMSRAENGVAIRAVNTPMQQEAPSQNRLIKLGDSDAAVVKIQERLVALSYIDGDEPTEYFGEPLEAALKRFQRVHHMKETGQADELTQNLLFSDKAAEYRLEREDSGEDVEMLQERLGELGYEVEKTNGYFGIATSRALMSFQERNKLNASGVMDSGTADILYSNNARPKVDPAPTPAPKPNATPKPAKHPEPEDKKTPEPVEQDGVGVKKTAEPERPHTSGGGSVAAATGDVSGFIATAKAQQGKPYVLGDEGPNSFDCSGLVHYCLVNNGVKVGRMSASSFAVIDSWQTVSSTGELKPGDLLFFRSDSGSRISHTGIWLGGSKYIHASSSKGQVLISSWSDWAERNFSHGKRVF